MTRILLFLAIILGISLLLPACSYYGGYGDYGYPRSRYGYPDYAGYGYRYGYGYSGDGYSPYYRYRDPDWGYRSPYYYRTYPKVYAPDWKKDEGKDELRKRLDRLDQQLERRKAESDQKLRREFRQDLRELKQGQASKEERRALREQFRQERKEQRQGLNQQFKAKRQRLIEREAGR